MTDDRVCVQRDVDHDVNDKIWSNDNNNINTPLGVRRACWLQLFDHITRLCFIW